MMIFIVTEVTDKRTINCVLLYRFFFNFKQSTNENFGVKQAELVLAEDFCSK